MTQGGGPIEAIEVSDDHLLLTDLLEEHRISVKQVALAIGRSAPAVYRYCSGEATIPSIVWRWLYEKTRDQRIVKLFTGEVACAVVDMPAGQLTLDKPTVRGLLATRQRQIDTETCVLAIISDGRIDELDQRVVEKYRRMFPEMIESQYQTYLAINQAYEKKAKGARL